MNTTKEVKLMVLEMISRENKKENPDKNFIENLCNHYFKICEKKEDDWEPRRWFSVQELAHKKMKELLKKKDEIDASKIQF